MPFVLPALVAMLWLAVGPVAAVPPAGLPGGGLPGGGLPGGRLPGGQSVQGTPPGKWWTSDVYRREMGLTQEQSRRLEEIFQAALPGLRTHKQALDAAEKEFERLVERADDAAVMDQVDKVETARAALNKARTVMLLRMRKVLTTDQWVKLGALHQAAERAADPQKSGKSGSGK